MSGGNKTWGTPMGYPVWGRYIHYTDQMKFLFLPCLADNSFVCPLPLVIFLFALHLAQSGLFEEYS